MEARDDSGSPATMKHGCTRFSLKLLQAFRSDWRVLTGVTELECTKVGLIDVGQRLCTSGRIMEPAVFRRGVVPNKGQGRAGDRGPPPPQTAPISFRGLAVLPGTEYRP